jgi:hypothetical protein
MIQARLRVTLVALLAAVAGAEAQSTGATVAGTVRGSRDSAGLRGVEARFPQLQLATFSNAQGAFSFARVPDGTWTLQLRRVGFEPLDTTLNVATLPAHGVDFTMRALPQQLDTMSVSAEGESPGRIAEFEQRRARGIGVFLSREDLRANDERALADVLRSRVPGLALQVGAYGVYAFSRSQQPPGALKSKGGNAARPCYSQVIVDGITLYQQDNGTGSAGDPPDISQFLVRSLDGIEYYSGPSRTPPEFRAMGATCGTLVLWSRRR